jgi:glycosyltransferase involved in cell wall biosynthesis
MQIGFSGYDPDMTCQNGPVVSLNRMARSIQDQGLAITRQASCWRNDLNIYVVQAPRLVFKPYILRVDGIALDSGNTMGDTDALNKPIFRSLRKADGIFYISDFSRQLIETFAGPQNKPYVVIHNSISLEAFSSEGSHHRAALGWQADDLVFVASAKWRRWKRLPETLVFFEQFKRTTSRKCRLLILGGGEHVPTKDPDVYYAGAFPPSELASWYRTGNVFVHLATLEACGNTQIEAMACGLPVLCCANGGIGETVEKCKGGIVSRCDPPYDFTRVDHYHPSPPDYDILLRDAQNLAANLDVFKSGMDTSQLDIEVSALKLAGFCEQIYQS